MLWPSNICLFLVSSLHHVCVVIIKLTQGCNWLVWCDSIISQILRYDMVVAPILPVAGDVTGIWWHHRRSTRQDTWRISSSGTQHDGLDECLVCVVPRRRWVGLPLYLESNFGGLKMQDLKMGDQKRWNNWKCRTWKWRTKCQFMKMWDHKNMTGNWRTSCWKRVHNVISG